MRKKQNRIRWLLLAGLVTAASINLQDTPQKPHIKQENTIHAIKRKADAEEVIGTLRKYGSLKFEKEVDPKKPFFFYIGNYHKKLMEYDEEGIDSQIKVYNMLMDLHSLNVLDSIFIEGYSGRYSTKLITKTIGTKAQTKRALTLESNLGAHDFFMVNANFYDVFGILTPEAYQRAEKIDLHNIRKIEVFMRDCKIKGEGIFTREQIGEYIENYAGLIEMMRVFSEQSIFNVRKNTPDNNNVAVIIGNSHISDVAGFSSKSSVWDTHNVVYVSTTDLSYEYEKFQGNYQSLLKMREYMLRNNLSSAKFNIK